MNKQRWIERLGFVAVGVTLADLVRGGWYAVALFGLGYAGKWMLYQMLSTFFGVELTTAKLFFTHNDPVKRAIWKHAEEAHPGKWQNCQQKTCAVIS
jgi:hypothetical protein